MTRQAANVSIQGERQQGQTSKAASANVMPYRGKRVLIYGINYAPEPIGVGRYTGQIGTYLSEQAVDVEVVTAIPHYPGWVRRDEYRNSYKTEHVAAARVTRCPLMLRTNMRGVWRVLAPLSFAISSAPVAIWRIVRFRPDTVLCVEPTLFAAPLALLAAKIIGARTVLHVQDLEIDAAFAVQHLSGGWALKFASLFEAAVLNAFNSIITISQRMRERLEEKGVPGNRLSVVRNWVDVEKIKPLGRHSTFRSSLEIPDDTFVALYSGNIGRKQALSVMLDAAVELSEQKKILFLIVGDGPDKPFLTKKYGHLSNVRFLPVQPEESLCELLSLADIHVLPQHKGIADLVLPSKLGGMLASGKPCVILADPGTELFEFSSGATVIVPAGDATRLAAEILRAYTVPTPIEHETRERILRAIDYNTCMRQLVEVLFSSSEGAKLVNQRHNHWRQ